MERYKEIEKSIVTTYKKKILSNFIKGIKEYYEHIKDRCVSEIPDKTFFKALYNVRRVENSIDKDKYQFSVVEIETIADNRHTFMSSLRTKSDLKSTLGITQKTKIQMLFDAIYNSCDSDEIEEVLGDIRSGVKLYTDPDTQLCTEVLYVDGEPMYDEISLDIERMNLLSVLRKVSAEDETNPVVKRKEYK